MPNLLTPDDIEWKYVKHLTFTTESHYVLRDERFKIQCEKITKRDGHGKTGSTKTYYFIDSLERQFTDEEELCEAWNERNDFDDPNNEIIWVKKIVPIVKMTKE